MTRADVAEILAVLAAAFPEVELDTETTATLWEIMLADLGFDETQAAVMELIATHKWFPRIAEVRQLVVRNRLEDRTFTAFYAYLRRGGAPQGDIEKEALKLCGGRWEMNNTTRPGLWRKQLKETYEDLLAEKHRQENIKAMQLDGVRRRRQLTR